MERIQVLVSKLKDQVEQNADVAQMLITVQLLQTELLQQQTVGKQMLGTSKVAVVLPKAAATVPASFSTMDFEKHGPRHLVEETIPENEPQILEEKAAADTRSYKKEKQGTQAEPLHSAYDPLLEIPTLSHQRDIKEINEQVAVKQESLNDRLKQKNKELGDLLTGSPIKDLRKAIGINDRFVFISELFRGDEAMYERSIKTINGFNVFQEAEYWINRELIVKLGWDAESSTVTHFYQLVKRRFS